MSWRECDEGERAFRDGQSRWSQNPYGTGYGASYDERRNARDWEDGHRYAERRAEERQQEEARMEAEQRRQWEAEQYRQAEAEAEYYARQEAECASEREDSERCPGCGAGG